MGINHCYGDFIVKSALDLSWNYCFKVEIRIENKKQTIARFVKQTLNVCHKPGRIFDNSSLDD